MCHLGWHVRISTQINYISLTIIAFWRIRGSLFNITRPFIACKYRVMNFIRSDFCAAALVSPFIRPPTTCCLVLLLILQLFSVFGIYSMRPINAHESILALEWCENIVAAFFFGWSCLFNSMKINHFANKHIDKLHRYMFIESLDSRRPIRSHFLFRIWIIQSVCLSALNSLSFMMCSYCFLFSVCPLCRVELAFGSWNQMWWTN